MTGRGLVDTANEFGFRVALERGQPMAELSGELGHALMDLLERNLPIDAGLSQAEQVQVGTVEQEYVRHDRPSARENVAGSLSPLSLKGDSFYGF